MDTTVQAPLAQEANIPQKKRAFTCRKPDKWRKRIDDKKSHIAQMSARLLKTVVAHLTRSSGININELSELTGLKARQCYAVVRELMTFGELETLEDNGDDANKRLRLRYFDHNKFLDAHA